MFSDLLRSVAAISRPVKTSVFASRFAPSRFAPSLLVSSLLLFAVAATGCSDTTFEASPETVRALTILGSTDQGNSAQVVGSLRALDGVESVLEAIDARMATRTKDQLNEFLKQLGLDPDKESLSIYFSIGELSLHEMPQIVVFAPLTEARLESLIENRPSVDRISFHRSGNSYSFRDNRSDESIYFSLIEDELLLVAASQPELDIMHSRAHSAVEDLRESEEYPSDQLNKISSLAAMASQGQFWIASESVQQIFQRFPVETSSREFELLTKAVAGAAISFELHEKGKDGPAVSVSLLLTPKDGVNAEDLVDLVAGIVAFGRVNAQEFPQYRALLDRIEVSEHTGVARIAIDISASDIGDLVHEARRMSPAI